MSFDDSIGLGGSWPIRRPGRRGPVVAAVDGHRPPDRRLAGRLLTGALGHQPAHTEAPGPRVVALDGEHLAEEGERQLVGWVRGRARALVLQPREPVALKRLHDVHDMLARELEAGGDALVAPALVVHPHDGPAGTVGVLKLMVGRHRQRQLDGERMALEEGLDGVMIGVVAELALHDARELAVADGWVELLGVEQIARDDVGVLVLALGGRRASVDQAEHAALEEAVGLLGDGGAIQPGLPAALGDGLIRDQGAADDLVPVLQWVGEAQGQLLKPFGGRHGREAPSAQEEPRAG